MKYQKTKNATPHMINAVGVLTAIKLGLIGDESLAKHYRSIMFSDNSKHRLDIQTSWYVVLGLFKANPQVTKRDFEEASLEYMLEFSLVEPVNELGEVA